MTLELVPLAQLCIDIASRPASPLLLMMARDVLCSIDAAHSLLDANALLMDDGVKGHLSRHAEKYEAAQSAHERIEVACRAYRHGLLVGDISADGLDPIALVDACARDLGLEGVCERRGRLYAGTHDLGFQNAPFEKLRNRLRRHTSSLADVNEKPNRNVSSLLAGARDGVRESRAQ